MFGKPRHWIAALLAACCPLASAAARTPAPAQPPIITWNLPNLPPFHVLSEGRAPASVEELGDGTMDVLLRLVLQRLPQYQHRFVVLNGPRAEVERRAGLQLCSPISMRTPERLKTRYFTPAIVTGALHVVLRRERLNLIAGEHPSVSLQRLTRRGDLQGLLVSQRQYGAALQPWLKQEPGSNVQAIVVPRAGNLLTMLAAGRMDYTLEYPLVLSYYQAGAPGELLSLPIDELGEPPLGYFSCNRNTWGKAVMRDLDRALREVAARPEAVLQPYRRWLDETQFSRERPRLLRYLEQRARGGARIE